MELILLSTAAIISAITAIVFKQNRNLRMFSVFKPLTTIVIIVIALIIYNKTSSDYSAFMIVALIFSLIGDVFLLNMKFFLHGLSSFLIAHICFTLGFSSLFGFEWNFVTLIPLVMVAVIYYAFLRKDLKSYSIPVLLYMTVIVVMNWQAINLAIIGKEKILLGIAFASILFSFSDSILAYNHFKKQFKLAEILILSSYWISIFAFTIIGIWIKS